VICVAFVSPQHSSFLYRGDEHGLISHLLGYLQIKKVLEYKLHNVVATVNMNYLIRLDGLANSVDHRYIFLSFPVCLIYLLTC
jgi:hypothetical protein